jgi:hypothetical protein
MNTETDIEPTDEEPNHLDDMATPETIRSVVELLRLEKGWNQGVIDLIGAFNRGGCVILEDGSLLAGAR